MLSIENTLFAVLLTLTMIPALQEWERQDFESASHVDRQAVIPWLPHPPLRQARW